MILPVPPLLVISDRHQTRLPLEQVAKGVFAGGGRWFSLREKDLPPAERRALLGRLVALGRHFGAVVTVHEDIDAAAAADADGVHLPSAGSVAAARSRLPHHCHRSVLGRGRRTRKGAISLSAVMPRFKRGTQ